MQLLLTPSLLADITLSAAAYGYDPGVRAVTGGPPGARAGAAVGSLSGDPAPMRRATTAL